MTYNSGAVIHIMFLQPDPEKDPWLNRLTAALGGVIHQCQGFCHVEISVPHGVDHVSSSIYQGECVSCNKTKTFANPGYIVHSISVTHDELTKIKKFMGDSYSNKVKFDSDGMYFALLPFSVSTTPKNKTFCSRYVTEALQTAGINCVEGIDASLVSPSKLYKLLTEDNAGRQVMSTVDFKKNKMMSFWADKTRPSPNLM